MKLLWNCGDPKNNLENASRFDKTDTYKIWCFFPEIPVLMYLFWKLKNALSIANSTQRIANKSSNIVSMVVGVIPCFLWAGRLPRVIPLATQYFFDPTHASFLNYRWCFGAQNVPEIRCQNSSDQSKYHFLNGRPTTFVDRSTDIFDLKEWALKPSN